ncbi:hypothetical protein QF044_002261 [Chryseobacterium sp. W4I1]|nr:hypothetical protein [Chryseobacterium sp. W4I1]
MTKDKYQNLGFNLTDWYFFHNINQIKKSAVKTADL